MRMFTVCATALALTLSSAVASASILATEDFSGYTPAAALAGNGTAANGWGSDWHGGSGNPTGWNSAGMLVQATPMTFSPDYTNPVGGQSVFKGHVRLFRDLAAATTGRTYVSFVAPATGATQFDLNMTSDVDTSRVAEFAWGANPDAGNIWNSIKILDGSQDPTQPGSEVQIPFATGSETGSDLYVISLDPATNEVGYYLFLNGTSPLTGTADFGAIRVNNALRGATIDRVGIFNVANVNVGLSDIRIGTTPEDIGISSNALVATVPEPASLGLLALGGLALLRRRR